MILHAVGKSSFLQSLTFIMIREEQDLSNIQRRNIFTKMFFTVELQAWQLILIRCCKKGLGEHVNIFRVVSVDVVEEFFNCFRWKISDHEFLYGFLSQ